MEISADVKLKGVWKFTLTNIHTGEKRMIEKENLIPTVGRAAIASWLSQSSPSPATLKVNYVALGTDNTPATNADTTLGTETFRKALPSSDNTDNVAFYTAFYSAGEVSGTFEEAGMFIAGTGTVDTGTLFSRVVVSFTKTSSESLSIDYTITIS